ncbi:hypothetical protein ACP70R_035380 [Stipagrostis hirtigluma subsp. patula]
MPLHRLLGRSAAVAGGLRRGLSTAAPFLSYGTLLETAPPRPPWVMIYHTPLASSPGARRASSHLFDPPSASHLLVPVHLVDPAPGPDHYRDTSCPIAGGIVHAVSGDGLLLLDFLDFRGKHGAARARESTGIDADPELMKFVCNPLSGEIFRLPDMDGVKKDHTWHSHGLVTRSARGHGPPDGYAVAELGKVLGADGRSYAMRRFLSQTGEWDMFGLPTPVPALAQPLRLGHEVVAFAGRLWWVDVAWGAVSVDPFSDRPDLRFLELPRGCATGPVEVLRELMKYRRVGGSEGRLRYVEVTQEEPFVLSSFALDDDGSCWTLEHQTVLSRAGVLGVQPSQEDAPQILVVDPLNARVVHLRIGNLAFAVDMSKEKVLRWSTIAEGDEAAEEPPSFFKPCVLPAWLGSSHIPSAGTLSSSKANVKRKTLSDILVRADKDKKN